jgi:hypothetical protein
MTLQELFDNAWNAFVVNKQPQAFLDETKDVCAYHSPDGLKCAIGVSIPDEVYHPDMEGHRIAHNIDQFPELHELFLGIPINAISALQKTHDLLPSSTPFAERIQKKLTDFAANYNLTIPGEPK